ncbi:hypothetical protein R1flu_007110 [Riccia fluitans]|uniref:14-3-3 domain-containing protein n=1 Tax=Riccia fluitans TaxID=41844 RepID=A0ABD1YYH7_9MARC
MKGDYLRYLAQIKTGMRGKDAGKSALLAYKYARSIALAELAPSNPIRLGLALNFAVFYSDILKLPDRAFRLAKQAYDEAKRSLVGWGRSPSEKAGCFWHIFLKISAFRLNRTSMQRTTHKSAEEETWSLG